MVHSSQEARIHLRICQVARHVCSHLGRTAAGEPVPESTDSGGAWWHALSWKWISLVASKSEILFVGGALYFLHQWVFLAGWKHEAIKRAIQILKSQVGKFIFCQLASHGIEWSRWQLTLLFIPSQLPWASCRFQDSKDQSLHSIALLLPHWLQACCSVALEV